MGAENGQKPTADQAQSSEKDFVSGLIESKEAWIKIGKDKPSENSYATFYGKIQNLARSLGKKDLALAIVHSLAKSNNELGMVEGVIVGAGITAALTIASMTINFEKAVVAIILLIICAIASILLLATPIKSGSKRAKAAAFYIFAEDAIMNMDEDAIMNMDKGKIESKEKSK